MSRLKILRGRAIEPPLEVLPLSVWSPTSRGAVPPPAMPNEVTGDRDRFEAAGSDFAFSCGARRWGCFLHPS